MSESAKEMSLLARQIFDGTISYDVAISRIEQIEKDYGSNAFPPVPFTKKEKPWDTDYLKDLESQNMAGACSKEFLLHIAEVRKELDAQQRKHPKFIIVAAVVAIILLIIILSNSANAAYLDQSSKIPFQRTIHQVEYKQPRQK